MAGRGRSVLTEFVGCYFEGLFTGSRAVVMVRGRFQELAFVWGKNVSGSLIRRTLSEGNRTFVGVRLEVFLVTEEREQRRFEQRSTQSRNAFTKKIESFIVLLPVYYC